MNNSEYPVVSVSELGMNFSRVQELTDEYGAVIVAKHRKKRYKFINIEKYVEIEMSDTEKIDFVSERILKRYHKAFEELAK